MRYLLIINIARRIRIIYPVFLFCCMFITSCSYGGPPRIVTQIKNVRAKTDSHVIAVSLKYQKLRDPTGLNTFPNAGVPRILEEKVKIYICDIGSQTIRKMASFAPPDNMRTNWEPWILGWVNDKLFFQITGRSGTSLEDYNKGLNKIVYYIDSSGKLSEVKSIPDTMEFQKNTGPLSEGIFVRLSKGYNLISVKTDTIQDFQEMFGTENTKGELIILKND